jgi:hypothetical protein
MSKADKFKLETDGWYDDSEGSYDPGYNAIELWSRIDGIWVCVWESIHVGGDDLNGSATIKADLLKALPEFGLQVEDLESFDSDCIYDWEIK